MNINYSNQIIILLFLLCGFHAHLLAEQPEEKRDRYLLVQTGLNVNGQINSLGFRNSLEYKTRINDKVLKGYFLEHSTFIGILIDGEQDQSINWYCLGIDVYYQLFTLFNIFTWEVGGGVGFMHIYREVNKVGMAVNMGSNLNIRISNKFSVDIAPFILFPPVNRFTLSNIMVENNKLFHSFSIVPIGIRVKL